MRRRTAIHRVTLAGWLLLALACGGVENAAEDAVAAYNRALIDAYRLSDVSPLAGVATETEIRKVHALIDLKKANRLVLESTLEELAVTAVRRRSPEALEVETRERWRYHDRSLDPGRDPGPEFVARMDMRYEFVRRDGAWLMNKGRTLANEYLEPAGYTLPEHRPHGRQEDGT